MALSHVSKWGQSVRRTAANRSDLFVALVAQDHGRVVDADAGKTIHGKVALASGAMRMIPCPRSKYESIGIERATAIKDQALFAAFNRVPACVDGPPE